MIIILNTHTHIYLYVYIYEIYIFYELMLDLAVLSQLSVLGAEICKLLGKSKSLQ